MMGSCDGAGMRVLLVASILLLATVAFTGTASAQPEPPQCVYGGLSVTVGPVTVSNYCGQGPRVTVNEDCLRPGAC